MNKQAQKILKLYFEVLDTNLVSNVKVVQHEVMKAAEVCFQDSTSGSKLLGKRRKSALSTQKLEYLSMRQEKPKPLASYPPLIEDEFLMRVKKNRDEKSMKRKAKKAEKDAVRELRKDTTVIQQQRQNEKDIKRGLSRKNGYKVGQNLKDEV